MNDDLQDMGAQIGSDAESIAQVDNLSSDDFNKHSNDVQSEVHSDSTKSASKNNSSSKSMSKISDDDKAEIRKQKIAAMTLASKDKDLDLAQRRDVVNKTILRVLRRSLGQKFKEMFPKKFKSKDAKNKWYFEYIKMFCVNLFGTNHELLPELQFYMASIIYPSHMNKNDLSQSGISKDSFDLFHSCLYKYSHTKLINLFEVKPLGLIYKTFFTGSLEQILRSESSVCKNYDLYSVAFREFLEVFEGASDASTHKLD